MYKKQRPKLSVAAVINSAQNTNPNPANWFNGSNGCQMGALTGQISGQLNAPSTPTNIDLISANYTPNPNTFSQMNNTNGSINNSSFDHPSPNSSHGESSLVSKYPPNHPLSGSKHLCAICGDRASGRHYGLYSCEGCKGFFKRTVRKDLTYACREDRNCIIDKRQRNRCQYCRYQKCLVMGMKREAVQEERQRNKEKNDNEVESSTNMCLVNGGQNANNFQIEISAEKILNAELKVEQRCQELTNEDHNFNSLLFGNTMIDDNNNSNLNTKYLLECYQMIEWVKEIPYFTKLPIEDRIALLKSGWNELLIVQFSHRSMHLKDGIQLAAGVILHRNDAQTADVGGIYDRVLIELVAKMQEIRMDKCELGCLRAIVLFNPEAKGLKSVEKVEQLREVVYSTLEKYCHTKYSDQNSRFAKLLLRLPALRSVGLGLKFVDYLFINRDWSEQQMDNYLKLMLEKRTYQPSSHYHQSSSMNNSINSSLNSSLIGVNSPMNSISDNHHHLTTHHTLLAMSSNNLMNVIDSNNNLTNSSNSSGFSDLSAINFMGSNAVSTMNNLISMNGAVNTSNGGLYLSNANTASNANSISNLSINHTNSPLSLT